MARRDTLVKLLDDLRAACRISSNPAHNVQAREMQVKALQRKQEWFWDDFAWPHLRVDRYLPLQAGQRFYDLAQCTDESGALKGDLDITRISKIEVRDTVAYRPLKWGIAAPQYAVHDSELGARAWPVYHCQIAEDEQLEIWPIPDQDFDPVTLEGRVKITGIRYLKPLVDDDDRADIDGQLLVMHCAAEYLAAQGAKDAQAKMDQASQRYLKLRGQLMPRRVETLFINRDDRPRRARPIAVYKP